MVRQRRRPAASEAKERAARKSTATIVLWYEDNKRWLPLIGTVFGGATLFLLMQVKVLRNPVAFLGGLGWIVGYLVWGLGRPPDAPARPGRSPVWWPLLALLIATGLGLGYVYVSTVYRGAPLYQATLAHEGSKTRFRIDHPKQRLIVVVHGAFVHDAGQNAEGEYSIALSRGSKEITVDGKIQRSTTRTKVRRNVRGVSTSEFDYGIHEVASLGKGEYTIEHLGVGESLRPHLRVKVYTTWVSRLWLGVGGVGAFLFALLFDVLGSRAGHRTRAASAVASVASFTEAFRTMATPDAIVSAVLVGIIATFIVGGGLGWVSDRIAKSAGGEVIRPRRGRRGREDEDEDEDGDGDADGGSEEPKPG